MTGWNVLADSINYLLSILRQEQKFLLLGVPWQIGWKCYFLHRNFLVSLSIPSLTNSWINPLWTVSNTILSLFTQALYLQHQYHADIAGRHSRLRDLRVSFRECMTIQSRNFACKSMNTVKVFRFWWRQVSFLYNWGKLWPFWSGNSAACLFPKPARQAHVEESCRHSRQAWNKEWVRQGWMQLILELQQSVRARRHAFSSVKSRHGSTKCFGKIAVFLTRDIFLLLNFIHSTFQSLWRCGMWKAWYELCIIVYTLVSSRPISFRKARVREVGSKVVEKAIQRPITLIPRRWC